MIEEAATTNRRSKRGGGASARREARLRGPIIYTPNAVRNIPTYEVLAQDGLERLDDYAMGILETIGIEFRDDVSARIWAEAGADVQGHRVRIAREMIRKLISTVPSEYTYHGRNPERTVKVGGRNMIFGPAYGTPNIIDLEGVRRQGGGGAEARCRV